MRASGLNWNSFLVVISLIVEDIINCAQKDLGIFFEINNIS